MAMSDSRPIFTLYVVWHPDYTEGTDIANALRRRFGSDRNRDVGGRAGVSALYRNTNAPGSPTPIPIPMDDSDTTAVVVLIDNALAGDSNWTQYVQEISARADARGFNARLIPVAMDRGVLDFGLDTQAIRWDSWADDGAERQDRLVRDLTYEFIRILRHFLAQIRHASDDGEELTSYMEAIQVFLSHSKHDDDGESIAEAIRDWIHENSALSSFFDVINIPAGVPFASAIDLSIQNGAMVAIYTDTYSSREWCRREVMTAKLQNAPMTLVDCLRTLDERAFPYLGNVPVIRMDPNLMDRIPQIVGRLLDEAFRDFLWRCRVEALRQTNPQAIFISRPPELASLAALPNGSGDAPQSIVYPEPVLSSVEASLFQKIAPDARMQTLTEWLEEAQ